MHILSESSRTAIMLHLLPPNVLVWGAIRRRYINLYSPLEQTERIAKITRNEDNLKKFPCNKLDLMSKCYKS